MKYAILVLVAIVLLSCISQNAGTNKKEMSVADLIKSGQPVVIKDKVFDDEIDFTNMSATFL
jgi:hypothetical protein